MPRYELDALLEGICAVFKSAGLQDAAQAGPGYDATPVGEYTVRIRWQLPGRGRRGRRAANEARTAAMHTALGELLRAQGYGFHRSLDADSRECLLVQTPDAPWPVHEAAISARARAPAQTVSTG
ncbi:hypothetical protein HNR25_005190 [Streptomonospora salina]|uniref:Uncharacterized protein n=1 Tax=Streptomonospora salina TaxID=104205 RepID=A0A841EIZ2_9ACTN|nr:hypothetical protein [Streptomonospora salina]MBB6001359.1 hypothetical protein [Streptomonospora salina]